MFEGLACLYYDAKAHIEDGWQSAKIDIEYRYWNCRENIREGMDKMIDGIGDGFEMITTDSETLGRKRGYEKASKQYEPAFNFISKEFNRAMEAYEKNKSTVAERIAKLQKVKRDLENDREMLIEEVEDNTKKVASLIGVSFTTVATCVSARSIITAPQRLGFPILSVLGLFYEVKKYRTAKYESVGFSEAKEIYEKKLNKLKEELNTLRKRESEEEEQINRLIDMIMEQIIEERTKIAELNVIKEAA